MTLVTTSTDPRPTAPDLTRRGQDAGPADTDQATAMPWLMLVGAVALSLGSNVFAVLQLGANARSIGGVVYGAWPTTAFLCAAWLWHRSGRRGEVGRGWLRTSLVWLMRLAVAVPAAYVSLLHVHATAIHFGQPGMMSWAEAVGMEAVTALALLELDAGHLAVRAPEQQLLALVDDDGQAEVADSLEGFRGDAIVAAVKADRAAGRTFPARIYAERHGVSRQYAGRMIEKATVAA